MCKHFTELILLGKASSRGAEKKGAFFFLGKRHESGDRGSQTGDRTLSLYLTTMERGGGGSNRREMGINRNVSYSRMVMESSGFVWRAVSGKKIVLNHSEFTGDFRLF